MTPPALLPVLLAAPLQPSADEARRAAQEELARQVYRDAEPGLLERGLEALLDALDRLGSPSGPPAVQVLVVVALVLAVLVVALLLVRRTGAPGRRGREEDTPVLGGPASADDLRRAARRAREEGRHDDAVVDGFRALVRGLQERDLVPAAPGLTAAEAVRTVSAELPTLADRLAGAARLFDGVLYGGLGAQPADAEAVAALDAEASSARPASSRPVGAAGAGGADGGRL